MQNSNSLNPDQIKRKIQDHISTLNNSYPTQSEFISAITEQLTSLLPFFYKHQDYLFMLPYITHPDILYTFKVVWEDDSGKSVVNTGYRCHFNNAIGPYKGGLRFSSTVNESIIKFLAFEQMFKNALTGLPMGGAKGGSNFDPKNKSISEIRRFSISFARELHKIGITKKDGQVDTPAGDIGVSSTEIGYIFGELKRLSKSVPFASITGKPIELGGSYIRPEATGYGVVYIIQNALNKEQISLKGKKCLITGSGNVALYCAEKLVQLEANVLSVSDSNGVLIKLEREQCVGFSLEEVKEIQKCKFVQKLRLKEIAGILEKKSSCHFKHICDSKVWKVKEIKEVNPEIVFPCATQNEINKEGAEELIAMGVQYISEGANMPCDNEAIELFIKQLKVFIPSKAANAGGVAVSGLEMAQNKMNKKWSREKVDEKLKGIMKGIYNTITDMARELGDERNLVLGANAAGFKRVADAILAEGSWFER